MESRENKIVEAVEREAATRGGGRREKKERKVARKGSMEGRMRRVGEGAKERKQWRQWRKKKVRKEEEEEKKKKVRGRRSGCEGGECERREGGRGEGGRETSPVECLPWVWCMTPQRLAHKCLHDWGAFLPLPLHVAGTSV